MPTFVMEHVSITNSRFSVEATQLSKEPVITWQDGSNINN